MESQLIETVEELRNQLQGLKGEITLAEPVIVHCDCVNPYSDSAPIFTVYIETPVK